MAANYSGNKDAVQSPSPAPGPRVVPIASLVQDADGTTTANLYQEFKVDKDFIAHIQSAVGLDVPVLNASGSGFTTVTATALGGTVTPSGSVKIATGARFMIQIQTGGAVGTATFKTSVDGGNTYGALQTTAASMTDATSGITLAFAGTFTANGTAGFRSAFTPLAQWIDQAGNLRSTYDHNGYPTMGRVMRWEENWDWDISVNGANALTLPAANYAKWKYSSTGTAAALQTIGNSGGGQFTTPEIQNTLGFGGGPANGNVSRLTSGRELVSLVSGASIVAAFELGADLTGTAASIAMKVGLFTANPGAISGSDTGFGFTKQTGHTTWQAVTCNNGTATYVDTGFSCTDGSVHYATMELHKSGSPYGAVAIFFFDGKPLFSTTNLPADLTTAMFWQDGIDCIGAGVTSSHIYLGSIRLFAPKFINQSNGPSLPLL